MSFQDFLDRLGYVESTNNYSAENGYGFLGRYQMGESALEDSGYYLADGTSANDWIGTFQGLSGVTSKSTFLSNSTAQDTAMTTWAEQIWYRYIAGITMERPYSTRDLDKYEGQMLNGVEITVSGMVAGVHLVGQGEFKKYLESGGDYVPTDNGANPVPVTRYVKSEAEDSAKGVGGIEMGSYFTVDHSRNDIINGGSGIDRLSGWGGNDVINGLGGADTLYGGTGSDVLYGGNSGDELWGGDGSTSNGDLEEDVFHVWSGAIIKDADFNDKIFFFGRTDTETGAISGGYAAGGGIVPIGFEDPIAIGGNGLIYALQDGTGDVLSVEGQTLLIKWLWAEHVQVEHYTFTNDYLGKGNIELYEVDDASGDMSIASWLEDFKKQTAAFSTSPTIDPLIFDIDDDGFNLHDHAVSGVYFDIEGGDFAHRMGWADEGDAFLVRDLNTNGQIDDITEMFGNDTIGGFSALGDFDETVNGGNDDGLITSSDSVWSSLKLWEDADMDGVVDAGEMQTLAYHDIVEIDLNAQSESDWLINGNEITHTSTFTRSDSTTGAVADVDLIQSPFYTEYIGTTTVSGAAQVEPWLKGWGSLLDLDIAMTEDATLLSMVQDFSDDPVATPSSFDSDIEDILFRWAGVDGVSPTSRGANIDAQKLEFIEAYNGEDFWSEDTSSANPSVSEAALVMDAWDAMFEHTRTLFVAQGPFGEYFVDYSMNTDQDSLVPDNDDYLRSALDEILDDMPTGSSGAAITYWQDFAPLLMDLRHYVERPNGVVGIYEDHLIADLALAMEGRSLPVSLSDLTDELNLQSFSNVIEGADTLNGSGARDVLMDYTGDTTLAGGGGHDTYIFGSDLGQEEIHEDSGFTATSIFNLGALFQGETDTVRFTDLTSDEVTLVRDGNDLVVDVNANSDEVRIVGHFNHTTSGYFLSGTGDQSIEQIVFADGEAFTEIDIREEIITSQETDGHDYIEGTSDNDLFMGKLGNDTIVGGDDSDVYQFRAGDGDDLIIDQVQDVFLLDQDIVYFDSGISIDDFDLIRDGDDLIMDNTVTSDSITIQDQFWASVMGLEYFNSLETTVNAIINNPLWSLASVTEIPEGFDSEGYSNDSGIEFEEDSVGGSYTVTIDDLNYSYQAPVGDEFPEEEAYMIPAPNRRIEGFSFSDGSFISAEEMQDIMLERAKTDGNDSIYGFYHEDTLDGGLGDDTLNGGNDADTYIYDAGYGDDVIYDEMDNVLFKDNDKVVFGSGIEADDLIYTRSGTDLIITFDGLTGDSLTIDEQFNSTNLGPIGFFSLNNRVEEFHFADETVITWGDIQQELIQGTDGNDIINGFFWNDIMDGGEGDDSLYGGDMGDVYVYGYGYGNDVIKDEMTSVLFKDNDRVAFTPGITKDDVKLTRVSGTYDLRITLVGSGETLTIENQFAASPFGMWSVFSLNWAIEEFHFADGSAWSYEDVQDIMLTGTSGDDELFGFFSEDTLDGGAGNDYLEGWTEADTYIFAEGYGHDVIYDEAFGVTEGDDQDSIIFTDLDSTDVTFSRDTSDTTGEDLVITITATGETLTVIDQNAGINVGYPLWQIEEFHFDDTVLSGSDVREIMVSEIPTTGNDMIIGFYEDDVIDSDAGDDFMNGKEGSDTYIWGRGYDDDIIYDYPELPFLAGSDRVLFTSDIDPEDILVGRNGNRYDLVLTIDDTSETLTITNQHFRSTVGDPWWQIETFEFDDSTVWTAQDIRDALLVSTSGADNIIGFWTQDTLDGGDGNDTLDGGNDADTYVFELGDDHDVIRDDYWNILSDYRDTIQFGSGITSSMIELSKTGNDMLVEFTGYASDSITIDDFFLTWLTEIEIFDFATGSDWDSDHIYARLIGATTGADSIGSSADTNWLAGVEGDDTIDAASGNQTLRGGEDDDTYIFGVGYDNDIIMEEQQSTLPSGDDTIEITGSLTLSDFYFDRWYDDLIIGIIGETDTLTVKSHFTDSAHEVENFIVDSTTYDLETLLNTATDGDDDLVGTSGDDSLYGGDGADDIEGYNGDDTIIGGTGNDTLNGSEGNDVYMFALGDGHDVITDYNVHDETIVFSDEIDPEDVILTRSSDDLVITYVGNSSDSITVSNHFDATTYYDMEYLQFADGTVWELAEIRDFTLTPTSGDDYLNAFYTADTVYGGDGNDTILAGDGNDIIYGEAGDDYINGVTGYNDGLDTFYGGDGDDSIFGGWNDDLIYGGDGSDTIDGGYGGGNEADTVYGGGGGDTIYAYQYDTIYGEEGDDFIEPSDITDVNIDGGTGFDTVNFMELLAYLNVTVNLSTEQYSVYDTISTTSTGNMDLISIEQVYGSEGDDSITGSSNDDTLRGGWGDDTLDGGSGTDMADYSYIDGYWAYTLNVDLGAGTMVNGSENTTLTSIENFAAGDGDDTLDGSTGANLIYGNAGVDLIDGDAGDDTLYGGDGADSVDGSAGDDHLVGGEGADTMNGGADDDTLHGGDGDDSLDGGTDDDELYGAKGADYLQGNAGADSVYGGDGDDTVRGGADADIVEGDEGDDELRGDLGNDTLDGGEGSDTLYGGAGNDSMTGGAGADIFMIDEEASTADIIADFEDGVDIIDLDDTEIEEFGDITSIADDGYGNALITLDNSQTIKLEGVDYTLITDADFAYADPSPQTITGGAGDETITGGGAGDTIDAAGGADTITGGAGDDTIQGGYGDDVYIYNIGDGDDELSDYGGTDTISFGTGIELPDLTFSRINSNLDLQIDVSGGGSVYVEYEFYYFMFEGVDYDGGSLTAADIRSIILDGDSTSGNDTITGFDTADTIEGGAGDDTIEGGYGDDLFVYETGDGDDVITDSYGTDTIAFGTGIEYGDLTFSQVNTYDLLIEVSGGGEVLVDDHFYWNIIDYVTYDGGSIDQAGIAALV